MYRKAGEDKLKGYWYSLVGKELYFYKRKGDEKHRGMYNLTGVVIREEKPE